MFYKLAQDAVQMPDQNAIVKNLAQRHGPALSRVDYRGLVQPGRLSLANTELVQLRRRVITLEDAVISLLAQSSDEQLDRAREVSAYISPRPGFTPHSQTLRAAAEWIHLVERARHLRGLNDSIRASDLKDFIC